MRALLIAMLTCSSTLAEKPARNKPAAREYQNYVEIKAPCGKVWGAALSSVLKRGFTPETSDRAGGVLKLRWARGNSGWLQADRDVKAYTAHKKAILESFGAMRIDGAVITLVEASDTACLVTMTIEYHGHKKTLGGAGWFVLPSNNRLESEVLAAIDAAIWASAGNRD